MPCPSLSIIDDVRLTLRGPSVSVMDLAVMLEIDLTLGRQKDFRIRLQRALNDACRQGQHRGRQRITSP